MEPGEGKTRASLFDSPGPNLGAVIMTKPEILPREIENSGFKVWQPCVIPVIASDCVVQGWQVSDIFGLFGARLV